MQSLNLPIFNIQIKEDNVFCLVRKKWVALTPEEWVRQHFLNLLINHLSYPKGMMRLEHSISYFKNLKRSDISVLGSDSNVYLLIECKAPNVPIDQKAINQISEYNKVLDSNFIAVTNRIKHFVWRRDESGLSQIQDFPFYHQ